MLVLVGGGVAVAVMVVVVAVLGATGGGSVEPTSFVDRVVGAWDCTDTGVDYIEIGCDGTFETRSGGRMGTTIMKGTWIVDSGRIRLTPTLGDRPKGSFAVQGGGRLFSIQTFDKDGQATDPARGWIDSIAFSESGSVVDITLAGRSEAPGASVQKQDMRCMRR